MALEHATTEAVPKPWGSTERGPWCEIGEDGAAIGELWFHRADRQAPPPALLLKLLFTGAPLSIQVHPGDAFARSIGLERGKTEAWYVISAIPDAQVALGLKRRIASDHLRAAILDGSISDLVEWRDVAPDDAILVPAGTIHAIGAGLVIAEIQQRSDSTFRLFDHGRRRDLHLEHALAVADAGPVAPQASTRRLTTARTLLVASPYFVLERVDLPPGSNWMLRSKQEIWFLVLEGHARVGLMNALVGEAVFLEDDEANIAVGREGLKGLLAYVGGAPVANLLRERAPSGDMRPRTIRVQPT